MEKARRFLVVGLDPRLERTLRFPAVEKGEVNRTSEYSFDAGGSGVYVARALTHLDAPVTLFTPLGGSRKETFLALLREEGIEVEVADGDAEVPTSYTILDAAEGSTTELEESAPSDRSGIENKLRTRYGELLGAVHTVVICASGSASYSDEFIPFLIEGAREAGARVVVDCPDGGLENVVAHKPDLLKVGAELFMRELGDGAETLTDAGVALLLVENGGRVRFGFPGGAAGYRDAMAVDAINPRGSQSALTAAFVAEWRESGDLDAALERAVVAASMGAGQLRPGAIR